MGTNFFLIIKSLHYVENMKRIFECTPMNFKANKNVFLLIFTTFAVILPICLHGNPDSMYFVSYGSHLTKTDLKDENAERLNIAGKYFKESLEKGYSPGLLHTNDIDIAISIITVSRNRHEIDDSEPRYLTQCAMRLLHLLASKEDRKFRYHISICNVDRDSESYEEARNVSKVLPMVVRFSKPQFPSGLILEKEKQDYVFCLNETLKLKPQYAFLVEDDAYANDNMFDVLEHMITNRLDLNRSKSLDFTVPQLPVGYVKLFHPNRLLKFYGDVYQVAELFALATILGTFASQTHVLIFNIDRLQQRYKLWLFWTLYIMCVLLAVGHVNVIQLRTLFSPYLYTIHSAPSCCTPAILYPAENAKRVVDFMSATQCKKFYGKDSILDDFMKQERGKLRALLVEPNVFKHIGMYSSLRAQFVDPRNV